MAASQARIDANRRNALKSTGPKTLEGKAKSRANALKHGLTGDGVVVPADDLAKVDAMEAKLAADIEPANEVAASLVRRYAALSVRLDRCAEHDDAMTARRVRKALADHDNQRHDEVAAQAARLADEPFDAVRRLKQTPEGLDWLIGQWEEIQIELGDPAVNPSDLARRAGMLMGLSPTRSRVSRWGAWARSASEAGDPAGWADAEVATLRTLRAEVDEEAEAADRDEAAARALFDFGPEAERMRRYEAAAERHLFRVLRELKQIQGEAGVQNEPKPAPAAPAPLPAPASPESVLASFLAAERRILDVLPMPARPLGAGLGDFIDVAASPAARAETNPRARRPRLR